MYVYWKKQALDYASLKINSDWKNWNYVRLLTEPNLTYLLGSAIDFS